MKMVFGTLSYNCRGQKMPLQMEDVHELKGFQGIQFGSSSSGTFGAIHGGRRLLLERPSFKRVSGVTSGSRWSLDLHEITKVCSQVCGLVLAGSLIGALSVPW